MAEAIAINGMSESMTDDLKDTKSVISKVIRKGEFFNVKKV